MLQPNSVLNKCCFIFLTVRNIIYPPLTPLIFVIPLSSIVNRTFASRVNEDQNQFCSEQLRAEMCMDLLDENFDKNLNRASSFEFP